MAGAVVPAIAAGIGYNAVNKTGLLGQQQGAAGRLLQFQPGGLLAAKPAGPDPSTGINWNQARPEDAGYKNDLTTIAMGGPLARFQAMQAQEAKAAEPYTLNAGDIRIQNGKTIASAPFAPVKPETFKPGSTRDFVRGTERITQEFDGTKWNDIARGAAFAPDKPEKPAETWTTMTPEQVSAANLPTGGTYQQNSRGQVQVITQPKQDPTSPQKYKDQVASMDQLSGTLDEYEKLLNDVGTEYWNSTKAARLDSLQTQMKFGIKGIEQTGALDKGSIDVMGGMVPDATSFSANIDPLGRGAARAKAKVAEMKSYLARSKISLDKGYRGDNTARPAIGTVEDGYRYRGGDPANPNSWEAL